MKDGEDGEDNHNFCLMSAVLKSKCSEVLSSKYPFKQLDNTDFTLVNYSTHNKALYYNYDIFSCCRQH